MDARGGLIRHPQLGPPDFFLALGYPRFEHHLEGPHLLVGDGDDTARQFGFGLNNLEALILDRHLDLAPIEHSLQIAEQCNRQGYSGSRALRSIDLADDHPDARLGGVEQGLLLLNGAQVLGQHLALLVEQALALFQRNF